MLEGFIKRIIIILSFWRERINPVILERSEQSERSDRISSVTVLTRDAIGRYRSLQHDNLKLRSSMTINHHDLRY